MSRMDFLSHARGFLKKLVELSGEIAELRDVAGSAL
jgi:hypothetical protein